jgi:hypothetical protein
VLVEDAIQAVLNTNITKAILRLNIADQELVLPAGGIPRQQPTVPLKSATFTHPVNAKTNTNFLLYQNARDGVTMQYAAN